MTTEEFDQLTEPDHLRYELDCGELLVARKPFPRHNRVVVTLLLDMAAYTRDVPVGEVFNSDCLFVLGPLTKRAPDIAFRCAERAATR